MTTSAPKNRHTDLLMAAVIILILGTMLVPVPTPLLDLLLAFMVGLSILIIVFVIKLSDPLEFSSFPSILLLVTLFRLALNVATTRQILLNAFGGHVIQAFGDFVVGGNYVVGLVIFSILVVINFMVITKGAGRIAEVAARFTLDAMPGKQMSIDADLNQGLIDDKEALRRRRKLTEEADFYGAMDGASKFVRGDAVAGLIITLINVTAGFAVGMLQKQMTAPEALARYTILTIGDGLVQQIPALIISTAAGVLVTRAASDNDLGSQVGQQLFAGPKQLMIAGGILSVISIVPGLPFLPFIALGGSIGGFGYALQKRGKAPVSQAGTPEIESTAQTTTGKVGGRKKTEALPSGTSALRSVLTVSPMDLEIGFGLVPLVDRNQGGRLIERIGNVRNQMAEEIGIVLPPVNVRDNVHLKNMEYSIKIRGLEVARGAVRLGSLLAIDPSGEAKVEGYTPVREPAFGFLAYWIPESKREMVESKGLTVVDCASVITTHLAAIVKRHATDILTRQDVHELIDQLKESQPAVVQELIPNKMSIGVVHRVLQGLLREKVAIRDLSLILETLSDNAGRTQEIPLLVELCRRALGGHIVRDYLSPDGTLKAIGIHPDLETLLRKASHKEGVAIGTLALDPAVAQNVLGSIRTVLESSRKKGVDPILLCSPAVRPALRQLIQHDFRETAVLSFLEVPDTVQVDILSMITAPKGVECEAVLDG